jgi:hypothetical protein
MPRRKTVDELGNLIGKLQQQRREHEGAIAAIDRMFARFGIQPGARRGPGRPAGMGLAAAAVSGRGRRRRRRGTFKITGEQSIIEFIKRKGKPSTKEINEHWIAEGRGGKADNTLTRLVKGGQLKRVKSKDVRGSRYAAA